jgi:glycosyltransferase involved in cell wall biosynthesis
MSFGNPRASVIVRTKDKRREAERAFRALREQTVEVEIVVVDSGSTDGTLDVARRWCDRLVEIPPQSFTFGHALNVGASHASGPVHFALSAHCWPERADWIELSLAHYERPEVAGANGQLNRWDGRPLVEPVDQTLEIAQANPYWGFSNHASSWRRSVWQEHAFSHTIESCEDKEWGLRVLRAGYVLRFDPRLTVSGLHRKQEGTAALFRRTRKEARALASEAGLPERSLRAAIDEWWNDLPVDSVSPPAFHRVNWLRIADIAGRWLGEREGRGRPLGAAR